MSESARREAARQAMLDYDPYSAEATKLGGKEIILRIVGGGVEQLSDAEIEVIRDAQRARAKTKRGRRR